MFIAVSMFFFCFRVCLFFCVFVVVFVFCCFVYFCCFVLFLCVLCFWFVFVFVVCCFLFFCLCWVSIYWLSVDGFSGLCLMFFGVLWECPWECCPSLLVRMHRGGTVANYSQRCCGHLLESVASTKKTLKQLTRRCPQHLWE
jgi:hypothetical protein